ncbi:unnamed protein product [Meloidogyne enterolobii]|uniref:Uncharacterized protein n=2 Tax=Meloidogyne enterolobii TaxID=390850 RepID=A0ACB1B346_MELEN|nr:unnamed protein product [Meloidogyne enterolobii]
MVRNGTISKRFGNLANDQNFAGRENYEKALAFALDSATILVQHLDKTILRSIIACMSIQLLNKLSILTKRREIKRWMLNQN